MGRYYPWPIIKAVILVCLCSYLRVAVSATAVATITVNIVKPAAGNDGLTVSSMELDLYGKSHDEIIIINTGSQPREIFVELNPLSDVTVACEIRYSPKYSSIPPWGRQVVRLMKQGPADNTCTIDHQLLISDVHAPEVPIFRVSI